MAQHSDLWTAADKAVRKRLQDDGLKILRDPRRNLLTLIEYLKPFPDESSEAELKRCAHELRAVLLEQAHTGDHLFSADDRHRHLNILQRFGEALGMAKEQIEAVKTARLGLIPDLVSELGGFLKAETATNKARVIAEAIGTINEQIGAVKKGDQIPGVVSELGGPPPPPPPEPLEPGRRPSLKEPILSALPARDFEEILKKIGYPKRFKNRPHIRKVFNGLLESKAIKDGPGGYSRA